MNVRIDNPPPPQKKNPYDPNSPLPYNCLVRTSSKDRRTGELDRAVLITLSRPIYGRNRPIYGLSGHNFETATGDEPAEYQFTTHSSYSKVEPAFHVLRVGSGTEEGRWGLVEVVRLGRIE